MPPLRSNDVVVPVTNSKGLPERRENSRMGGKDDPLGKYADGDGGCGKGKKGNTGIIAR